MTDSSTVYSTGTGRVCPQCSRPVAQCICKQQKTVAVPKTDGIVRVGREIKGRKGKGVTVISGIPLNAAQLEDMAKRLKQLCGAGGTIKDGVIEIQGEHRDTLADFLKKQGFSVKKSGG
jgi:translation initiation factor 1